MRQGSDRRCGSASWLGLESGFGVGVLLGVGSAPGFGFGFGIKFRIGVLVRRLGSAQHRGLMSLGTLSSWDGLKVFVLL